MSDNAKTRSRGNLVPLRRVDGLPAEMSDEALLAACALGDRAALGALYDRLSPHVWRFLSRMAGNQLEELEDLVQATFIAVHASAVSFKGTSLVRTWVFAIAANVTRRHVRDEVRRRSALERLSKLPALPSARPDESLEQHQLMLRMREALSGLPHDLRVALVMCDLEDIPGREAAAVLQIPEGTLYRRVHEARRALGALIEEGRP
jgi:RNA polymerase sigma-70 factor (ECF subfamily)